MKTEEHRKNLDKEFDDPRFADSILAMNRDQIMYDHDNGEEVGEFAHVVRLEHKFSWKKAFLNCWTGYPNDGKTEFFMFMALVMAKEADWKWRIFSPEMISSHKKGSAITLDASDIYKDLAWTLTGKTPYKHFAEKYKIEQIPVMEYQEALDFVEKHFSIIHPKDRTYTSLIDNFKYWHEVKGADGFLVDPFKNVKIPESKETTDKQLDTVFEAFRELAIETNTSINIIAHPRSLKENKNKDGSFKVCNQFMLSGGAAWNNNMDGIYSIYRPFKHKEITDPNVHFHNLKQRKQPLVGRPGVVENIVFDFMQKRYFFNGVCPIDVKCEISFKEESDQLNVFDNGDTKDQDDAPF